eukprot:Seg4823.3 transcript_id=Seg4823.3/GoldUCD/mRNA.D3Y31 product="hypothetical protein" protein_id=Seg4823.3/GoldUCD/D3Y31
MAENIDITKKRRSVTRRSTTILVNKVQDLKGAHNAMDARILQRTLDQLNGKREQLKELDTKISESMIKNYKEDACDKEVEDVMEAMDVITRNRKTMTNLW